MVAFVIWFLIVSVLGWSIYPLVYRIFFSLPDRGFAFSKIFGLLIWGYIYWLLTSLGILHNRLPDLIFVFTILFLFNGWLVFKTGYKEIRNWWKLNKHLVFGIEILFLLTFAGWVIVRSANPESVGTEKPMELAFINAILKSDQFPPNDPWLSGYAISYYYFGYVIIAMLAKFSGTMGSEAFNLGLALVFGLSVIGAFGLVFNLSVLNNRQDDDNEFQRGNRFSLSALLGPIFLLIISNLEGFLHALHTRGFFWKMNSDGQLISSFWTWLDIKDLNLPPQGEYSWVPSNFWWWWRASRVIQDYDLAGNLKEIINEFPFFSFLLGDLHPHVLVMPFAILILAVSLHLLIGTTHRNTTNFHWRVNNLNFLWAATCGIILGMVFVYFGGINGNDFFTYSGVLLSLLSFIQLARFRKRISVSGYKAWTLKDSHFTNIGIPLFISKRDFVITALVLGAIAFLNTWDTLVFLTLATIAYAIGRIIKNRIEFRKAAIECFWLGLCLSVAALILYLPFYLSFSSQAGGIIPNLIYSTRGIHFWVMFFPLLIPIFLYLFYLVIRYYNSPGFRLDFRKSAIVALFFLIALWLSSLFIGYVGTYLPNIGELFLSSMSAINREVLFSTALLRRLNYSGGWLTMALLLVIELGLLKFFLNKILDDNETNAQKTSSQSVPIFILLLILFGTLLVIGPEFYFLRDQFGWRINTIFKFYFQTWLLWSLAAAIVSITLFRFLKSPWKAIFLLIMTTTIAASLFYPALSLWNKTNGFSPSSWTLDSAAYLAQQAPDEKAAMDWLSTQKNGVLAEAISPSGGSYSGFARMSTNTGLPTVLGWVGHEIQWRGGSQEIGSRQSDIQRLYCSRDWSETKDILDLYKIKYVIIGSLERSTYAPNTTGCPTGLFEPKFSQFLNTAFRNRMITIYEYNPTNET